MQDDIILIGHGSGGRLSHELIENIFRNNFSNAILDIMGDASVVSLEHTQVAITTDSYVIDPIFFPGGDIGKLAVSGTINDLCVSGAIPKYLTASFIIEEGFKIAELTRIVKSMAEEARRAGVLIIAGDTKVVRRSQCDKIFINTSGIGILPENRSHINTGSKVMSGDKLIVSGTLGNHAIAVLAAREKLLLDENIQSDAAPLNSLTEKILIYPENIRFMRDITRGGLATILVESCANKPFGMFIREEDLPIDQSVRSVCELYGFDPLHLANEGKIMIIVKEGQENVVLDQLKSDSRGAEAVIIGEVTLNHPGRVIMESVAGGKRIVEMLSGEMLPRIC